MLGFYAYQRVFLGTPESVIWADAYFRVRHEPVATLTEGPPSIKEAE